MIKHRDFLIDLQTSEQFYNDQESRQIIGELIAMIDEGFKQQPKTDWIPCIVTLKDGRSLEAIYDNISKRFIMYEHEVIAWQPLPAPYKKEGAE